MHSIKIIIVASLTFQTVGFSQIKELPVPSGKYAIGTILLDLTDSTRYDPFLDGGLQYRELTAKVWYPAHDDKNIEYEKYLGENKNIQKILQLPEYTGNLKTHSKNNLKIAKSINKYPVLIFNHGWGEHFLQNTILMEELASNGYVVFSLAHHYECKFSIYPDSELFILDPVMDSKRLKKIFSEQTNTETMKVFKKMFSARTKTEQKEIFQKANELLPTFFIESPRLWSKDIFFLLDKIGIFDNTMFDGALDLDRVGVLGMSMGGIASQQICVEDERVKAGLSMDGGFYGDTYYQKISRPFMFINSYRYIGYEKYFLEHLSGKGYVVTIPNADHYNFHDISIMDLSHPMLGEIDGNKCLQILNKLVLRFFDNYLKNDNQSEKFKDLMDIAEVNFFSKD